VVEIKAAVTETDAEQLVQYASGLSDPMLVVSRRIADGARRRFSVAGSVTSMGGVICVLWSPACSSTPTSSR